MDAIFAENVSKNYGHTQALNNVSLKVEAGTSFALLGKNGAGKTTFVKSLLDLVSTKEGTLRILGVDSSQKEARQKVAYLPEKFSFYPYYTLKGVCEFYGMMKGIKGQELQNQVSQAMDKLGIGDLAHKKVKECSKGQLQRTGIAATLVGDTELFILDEPFSGLDPIAIKELQDLLRELQKNGKTVFINSHGLDAVEKVCETMAIIDNGKVLVEGNIKNLVGDTGLLDFFYEKVGRNER